MPPPTVDRLAPIILEVAWENRSPDELTLTVAEDGELVAVAEVPSCGAHNVIVETRLPFEVGLGQEADAELQPTILSGVEPRGESYRFVISIDAQGTATIRPLMETPEFVSAGTLC